jgi:hypothetical protein
MIEGMIPNRRRRRNKPAEVAGYELARGIAHIPSGRSSTVISDDARQLRDVVEKGGSLKSKATPGMKRRSRKPFSIAAGAQHQIGNCTTKACAAVSRSTFQDRADGSFDRDRAAGPRPTGQGRNLPPHRGPGDRRRARAPHPPVPPFASTA